MSLQTSVITRRAVKTPHFPADFLVRKLKKLLLTAIRKHWRSCLCLSRPSAAIGRKMKPPAKFLTNIVFMPSQGEDKKGMKPKKKAIINLDSHPRPLHLFYFITSISYKRSLHLEQLIPVERYGLALANLWISALLVFPFSWHVKQFEIIWSFLLLQDLWGPKARDSENS